MAVAALDWPFGLSKAYHTEQAAVIGQGAYGQVYQLQHRDIKAFVAVKVLSKAQLTRSHDLHTVGIETAALQLCNTIPYTVQLFQVEETGTHVFLVLEHLPQGDMCSELEHHGRMSLAVAQTRFAQVLLAVDGMHQRGIAVRDIKPENVMFNTRGQCVLIDFGLATTGRNTDNASTALASTRCGTESYTAPEVWAVMADDTYDAMAADVWAMGCLLFTMLHGKPPYGDDNADASDNTDNSDDNSESSDDGSGDASMHAGQRAKERGQAPYAPWLTVESQELLSAMLEVGH
jgi:serine/threonine protein kinase